MTVHSKILQRLDARARRLRAEVIRFSKASNRHFRCPLSSPPQDTVSPSAPIRPGNRNGSFLAVVSTLLLTVFGAEAQTPAPSLKAVVLDFQCTVVDGPLADIYRKPVNQVFDGIASTLATAGYTMYVSRAWLGRERDELESLAALRTATFGHSKEEIRMAAELAKIFETWIRFEKINLRHLNRIKQSPASRRFQEIGWFWLKPWPASSLLIAPRKTDGLTVIKLAIQTSLYANVKTVTKITPSSSRMESPGVGVLNDLTGRFEVSSAGRIIRERTFEP